jgi:hypothetical protein
MSVIVQKVNPGDLITAASWNLVVDTLVSLQSQIDGLGSAPPPPSGSKPVITSTEPSPVAAGSTLTIHGSNFGVPAVLNTVTLGGTPLTDFVGGSTDKILNVVVPGDIPGPLPMSKTLVLTTSAGDANATVDVTAAVVPIIGAIVVKNASGTLPASKVGDTIPFQFTLDANGVNIAEQYHLHVEFNNAVGATTDKWQQGTSYTGVDSSQMVTVDPTQPVTVGVNVVVPTAAKTVDMTVWAISVHHDPGSSSNHLAVPITVGEAGPQADPSIHLSFGSNASPFIHSQDFTGAVAGTGLAVGYGTNPVVEILLSLDSVATPGTFTVTGQVENADSTLWIPSGLPKDVPFSQNQPGQSVHFNLQLVPTKAVSGTDVTRFFMLTVTRKEDTGVGKISNFFRFPIGGF